MLETLQLPNEAPGRYIPNTIAKSHPTIDLLTQNSTCQCMLSQAFFHTLAYDEVKMIILHNRHLSNSKKLPDYLKSVIWCQCLSVNIPNNIIFIEKIKCHILTNKIKY